MKRREFLIGISGILATGIAPALPRASNLMRIVPRSDARTRYDDFRITYGEGRYDPNWTDVVEHWHHFTVTIPRDGMIYWVNGVLVKSLET